MKSLINLFLFVCFSAALAISCNPDPCKDTVCGDYGTCMEGACDCDFGYEKDSVGLCNVAWTKKFVGNYKAGETCVTGDYNYNVKITESQQQNNIVVENLYDAGVSFSAPLVDAQTFEIPTGTTINNSTVSGTGSYAAGNITITYVVTNGGASDTCTNVLSPL